MTENKIKHFETLWEESEKLSQKAFENVPNEQLITKIIESLSNYTEASQIESKEIADSLKSKHIGEVVFMITALSLRENINVYAALQECCVLRSAVNELV